MRILGILTLLLLSNCAMRTPYMQTPTVNMAGVDPVKYNNDLGECQALKIERNKDTLFTTNIIADCMTAKGYQVLSGQVSG